MRVSGGSWEKWWILLKYIVKYFQRTEKYDLKENYTNCGTKHLLIFGSQILMLNHINKST